MLAEQLQEGTGLAVRRRSGFHVRLLVRRLSCKRISKIIRRCGIGVFCLESIP